MLCWITISAGMKPVSTTESRVSEAATWGVDIFTLEFDRFPGVRFVDSTPQSPAYDKTHYAIYKRPRLSMGKLGNKNVRPHRIKVKLSVSFSPSGRLSAWFSLCLPVYPSFLSVGLSGWLCLSVPVSHWPVSLSLSLFISVPLLFVVKGIHPSNRPRVMLFPYTCWNFEFHTICSFFNELLAMRA